jgi:hypothetical protein
MYVNGMGFRAIERVKNVHHPTIINWVKEVGKLLPDCYDPETNPEVGELLFTYISTQRAIDKIYSLLTCYQCFKPGILGWVLGPHSAKTFEPLWAAVSKWKCYFYVTDGWKVYPHFIPNGDQIPPQNLYDQS